MEDGRLWCDCDFRVRVRVRVRVRIWVLEMMILLLYCTESVRVAFSSMLLALPMFS